MRIAMYHYTPSGYAKCEIIDSEKAKFEALGFVDSASKVKAPTPKKRKKVSTDDNKG